MFECDSCHYDITDGERKIAKGGWRDRVLIVLSSDCLKSKVRRLGAVACGLIESD